VPSFLTDANALEIVTVAAAISSGSGRERFDSPIDVDSAVVYVSPPTSS
jgi:hypothetical protein